MSEAILVSRGSWSRQWSRIHVEGKDAEDYLHRLTTVAVRGLAPGETRRGFLLNPQGRIRAAFYLHRRGPELFWLELDGGADQSVTRECLAALDEMHFGEKLAFTQDGNAPTWVFGANGGAAEGIAHGTADFGREWVSVWPDFGAVPAGAQEIADAELEDMRITALAPRLGHELTAQANPLELGLGAGIAENKGCYPGQEVIEKIISLGSPARKLALIEGSGLSNGLALTESGVEVGKLSSVTGDGRRGLAVLRKTAAEAGRALTTTAGAARVSRVT